MVYTIYLWYIHYTVYIYRHICGIYIYTIYIYVPYPGDILFIIDCFLRLEALAEL